MVLEVTEMIFVNECSPEQRKKKPADKGKNTTNGTEDCFRAVKGSLKRRHLLRGSKLYRQGKADRALNHKVLINCGFLPTGHQQTIPGCRLAHEVLGGLRCQGDADKAEPLRVNPQ